MTNRPELAYTYGITRPAGVTATFFQATDPNGDLCLMHSDYEATPQLLHLRTLLGGQVSAYAMFLAITEGRERATAEGFAVA